MKIAVIAVLVAMGCAWSFFTGDWMTSWITTCGMAAIAYVSL